MQVRSNDERTAVKRKIMDILDAGSFMEVGEHVSARYTEFYQPDSVVESDGVVTGYGTVNGNLVFVYAQDGEVMGGSFGEAHGRKIVKIYERAINAGAPVIGLLDCSGFRIEEGLDGLNQFAKLYKIQKEASYEIPQIAAVIGQCGGGMSIAAEQTDFLFIEKEKGKLFVTPSGVVDGDFGDATSVSAMNDGCFEWAEIVDKIKKLVEAMPANSDVYSAIDDVDEAELNRSCDGLSGKLGDARAMLSELSDDGELLETLPEAAADIVTGFIKLAGEAVGAVACNAVDGEKRLTAAGCDKAASFIDICNRFDMPIVMLTDSEGYKTDAENEKYLAKAAGRLLDAQTDCTAPFINVITGKVVGSVYSMLGSKGLGADYVFMWDSAAAGIMNSRQAVEVLYGNWTQELEDKYTETQSGAVALARHGLADKVIAAEDTRKYLIGALQTFVNSR
ncbi:MAG: carboxyl transferase [Mogibacterium sp.]|nr:carboxyl transferase [Mogibacterium sp.]